MRGRKPTKGEGFEFNVLTEDMPKCRTRIKAEYVPGIGAWLLMLGTRHAQALAKLREVALEARTGQYATAMRDQELRVEIVANFLQILGQPFNRMSWLSACEDFARLSDAPPAPAGPDDLTVEYDPDTLGA